MARLQIANNLLVEERYVKVKKQKVDDDSIVIYNRVPKTASTSFVNVAYDLCKRNGFNVLHLNVTGNLHVMPIPDQVPIHFKGAADCSIFIHFIDFRGIPLDLLVLELNTCG